MSKPIGKRKVKKTVEIDVEEYVYDNSQVEEAIEYCKQVKDLYNIQFYVLSDKQGYNKLEVQARQARVPFVIRFARYRMVVKSFFPCSKADTLKQEEKLKLKSLSRDLGAASFKDTIWYSKVYRPALSPDVNQFKLWLDYLCDEQKPFPKNN